MDAAADPAADPEALEGLWSGSWGAGQREGVIFQPVVAELFIRGDHVELSGFPGAGKLEGTVRFDSRAKRMHITPKAAADGQSASGTLDYAYEIEHDELTLTAADEKAISLKKQLVATRPLVNAHVELILATGINDGGDLLLTEFHELRAGQAGAAYFQPVKRSLHTGQATIFQVQQTGSKRVTVDEARGLIREPTPVVVTYRQIRMPANQLHELWTNLGQPTPESEAARQTFARIVRPGTLVFILSPHNNVAAP